MEQEDYSKIYEYESSGKVYAGEKACISMTSWKARINTCAKTIFSLLQQCPGFHIVLVLSKDEFPLKEKELPENLMLFVENNLIELFWIRPNLKSFKKVLFTMDKYRDVPVISADDDCIYKFNYAQMLYDKWVNDKSSFVSFYRSYYKGVPHTGGYATLHPPYCYGNILDLLSYPKLNLCEDDNLYTAIRYVKRLKNSFCYNKTLESVVWIHDERKPLHDLYRFDRKNTFNNKLNVLVDLVNTHFKVISKNEFNN